MGTVGAPECGDGMMCFLMSGFPQVCTPYCDPADPERGCPDNRMCVPGKTSAGAEMKICQPEAEVEPDAGAGPGSDDAGTEAEGGR
jgi:hypothetical protein